MAGWFGTLLERIIRPATRRPEARGGDPNDATLRFNPSGDSLGYSVGSVDAAQDSPGSFDDALGGGESGGAGASADFGDDSGGVDAGGGDGGDGGGGD